MPGKYMHPAQRQIKKLRKKKKKTRRRKKKGGILLTGALGYGLYQTQMKGKKAVFNLPVQYVDQPQPAAKPTLAPATGGKRTRKRKRKRKSKKRRKTRKRRGGADSLRDGIRKIYEGKKSMNFGVIDLGPGSWGRQLNQLYAEYLRHLEALTKGQKVARKIKNFFRDATTKKPLTEGEVDRIFYDEAIKMIDILERNFQEPIRQSIEEINMNPNAMIYKDIERERDPEKDRLSLQILEERPRLESLQEQIEGSIYELTQLIRALRRSRANSIPRHGSSIETNFSDSGSDLKVVQPYRGLGTPPKYIDV